MVSELLLPRPGLIVPKLPSYVKLDMAFGVGAGTRLFDKSRYRSHGDITGASFAAGLHGNALDFDPTIPSYVEIPATETQLDFTSQAFSMIFRLRIDSIALEPVLYDREVNLKKGIRVDILSNGRFRCITAQATADQRTFTTDGGFGTATWYTAGLSRSGASVRLYRDGVDDTDIVGTHVDPVTCPSSALIGILRNKISFPLDGKMEFLRIFGGIALSASEHLAYHNALA